MSRTALFTAFVVVVAGLGGWVAAQSQPGQETFTVPGPVMIAPGRFTVTAVGNSAVLLDTMTGRSWTFNNDRGARWVPFAAGIEH